MESEGFHIKGITFDLGNSTLTKDLNYQRNHYFVNPYDKTRKVFMFPDAPHLIKLVRNNLFDYGFRVPSEEGNLVPLVKQDFEEVLANNRGGSELRTAFSITRAHLDVKGSQRQRVRLAVQTLSNTVSQSILQFGPDTEKYKAKHKAVKLFNDWFDVMNAKSKNDKNPLSRGMSPSVNATNQLNILKKMEAFLLRFHVMDKAEKGYAPKAKMPWQHGLMCSIKATRALYMDLVVEGPFTFLLTAKLNQDCLENLFSRLRALGGDNCHPTAMEAMRRMRILLLNNGAELLIRQPAVEMESIQMEDEDGNPVSNEDIAEQKMILEKEKEEYTAEQIAAQIADHKARQEFIDRELISSQVAPHEDFPSLIEQYDIETEAANIFQQDLARMEAEEKEEQQRIKSKRDEDFTKIPRNVFDKTFFHESSTSLTINALNDNVNTDTIHFEQPVIITALTIVPNMVKLNVAHPQKRIILGRTLPKEFPLELYCNDISGTESDKASYLDSLPYDVDNGICTVSFPQNDTISNMLVLRGKYTSMTVMVVGRIEKKHDRESQGLGYVAGFISMKHTKNNAKVEERIKKAEEKAEEKAKKNGTTRKRKHEETEKTPFVPLGKKTKEATQSEVNDSLTPWIFSISRGGFVTPNREFFLDSEKFEEEFNAFHGFFEPRNDDYRFYGANEEIVNSSKGKRYFPFKKGPRIVDDLTDILVQKYGGKYDKRVLADFSKTRLNIRIKAAKIKLAEDNAARLAANKKKRQAKLEGNAKKAKTVRDLKQQGQLTNSGTRELKQQGQFTN